MIADHTRTTSFLGIRFWTGSARQLIEEADQHGGLFTVPSAPSLAEMGGDDFLKRAYQASDWAVVDGGYVALILRFVFRRPIPRISGLQILQKLLGCGDERVLEMERRRVLWVMPSREEAGRVEALLAGLGFPPENRECYVAPYYRRDEDYEDPELLARVRAFAPDWVILGIGGGRQEKLGLCLRDALRGGEGSPSRPGGACLPVILCTGGAIAFLTGGQATIPTWADRLYLGWLFRICEDPRRFGGRYFKAAWSLPWILWQFRGDLFTSAEDRALVDGAGRV